MPEIFSLEEEAARYVMGEGTAAERADFETRLAQSPQLQGLVRELEEGVVALAMTAPHKNPPPQVWQNIEAAVSKENKRQSRTAFWTGWWRNGWAVATACVIGWVAYAFWTSRPHQESVAASPGAETHSSPQQIAVTPNPSPTPGVAPQIHIPPAVMNQLIETKAREVETLRWQVVDLQNQLTQLTQLAALQGTQLSESNRLKFFQVADGNGSESPNPKPLSPALQHALFVAMARELGWAPSAPTLAEPANRTPGTTNQSNTDFVNLHPKTNAPVSVPPALVTPAELQSGQNERTQVAAANLPGTTEETGTATIAAFVSGDNLVLAMDATFAPHGSLLTFYGTSMSMGTAVMGDAPLVVRMPFSAGTGGWAVSTMMPNGFSNVIYFSAQGTGGQ